MKIKLAGIVFIVAAFLGASTTVRGGVFTFELLPLSGDVFGPAGSTVGWGYTLANPSDTEWLLLSGVSADPFLHGTPDSFIFDFPILGPGDVLSVAYVAGTWGLFELSWDLTAPVGFVNSGTFVVSAEWWDGDPFADGNFLGLANDQSASYSATVTPSGAVPEPGTLLLVLTGLAGVAWRARRAPESLLESRRGPAAE